MNIFTSVAFICFSTSTFYTKFSENILLIIGIKKHAHDNPCTRCRGGRTHTLKITFTLFSEVSLDGNFILLFIEGKLSGKCGSCRTYFPNCPTTLKHLGSSMAASCWWERGKGSSVRLYHLSLINRSLHYLYTGVCDIRTQGKPSENTAMLMSLKTCESTCRLYTSYPAIPLMLLSWLQHRRLVQ